jgi:hypothetical protein
MPLKCVNDVDSFCYVCGDYTIKLNRKTITPLIKTAHELYYYNRSPFYVFIPVVCWAPVDLGPREMVTPGSFNR